MKPWSAAEAAGTPWEQECRTLAVGRQRRSREGSCLRQHPALCHPCPVCSGPPYTAPWVLAAGFCPCAPSLPEQDHSRSRTSSCQHTKHPQLPAAHLCLAFPSWGAPTHPPRLLMVLLLHPPPAVSLPRARGWGRGLGLTSPGQSILPFPHLLTAQRSPAAPRSPLPPPVPSDPSSLRMPSLCHCPCDLPLLPRGQFLFPGDILVLSPLSQPVPYQPHYHFLPAHPPAYFSCFFLPPSCFWSRTQPHSSSSPHSSRASPLPAPAP